MWAAMLLLSACNPIGPFAAECREQPAAVQNGATLAVKMLTSFRADHL
jgi:hypothetical protein